MNYEQEIIALKSQIITLTAELETLKKSDYRANRMVDMLDECLFSLVTEVVDAHHKANALLYNNPAIVSSLRQLEKILGPADRPTPNAPPHS